MYTSDSKLFWPLEMRFSKHIFVMPMNSKNEYIFSTFLTNWYGSLVLVLAVRWITRFRMEQFWLERIFFKILSTCTSIEYLRNFQISNNLISYVWSFLRHSEWVTAFYIYRLFNIAYSIVGRSIAVSTFLVWRANTLWSFLLLFLRYRD